MARNESDAVAGGKILGRHGIRAGKNFYRGGRVAARSAFRVGKKILKSKRPKKPEDDLLSLDD